MKARCWQEYQHRALSSPDGPITAEKGDVVVVLVASSWSEAFKRLSDMVGETEDADRSIGR